MHIDAKSLARRTVLKSDLCIVGAGAAGLAIARELARSRIDIVLLESGGFEFDAHIQELYQGENVGLKYDLSGTRMRYFGGTTNHWGGTCYPLDRHDFDRREWLPYSGWPFGLDHLLPYYLRAQAVCQVGALEYPPEPAKEGAPDGFMRGNLRPLGHKSNPLRFGEIYRDEVIRSRNVRLITRASLLELESRAGAAHVTQARVKAMGGEEFFVSARAYVLAAGGIENPRLLLLSNGAMASGLGNQNDLVGRFFQEHVGYYNSAVVALRRPLDPKACPPARTWFTIADKALVENRLLNVACELKATQLPDVSFIERNFGRLMRRVRGGDASPMNPRYWAEEGVQPYDIMYEVEQTPNPDSRVTLGSQLDRLGQRKVVLDWRLTDLDRQNVKQGLEFVGREFGRMGEGRLWVRPRLANDWPPTFISVAAHHMGTTRMHVDPKQGVVDANCRVHGVGNLFIAGSSVFPTTGKANPTLTIVALALRLSDHLQGVLA